MPGMRYQSRLEYGHRYQSGLGGGRGCRSGTSPGGGSPPAELLPHIDLGEPPGGGGSGSSAPGQRRPQPLAVARVPVGAGETARPPGEDGTGGQKEGGRGRVEGWTGRTCPGTCNPWKGAVSWVCDPRHPHGPWPELRHVSWASRAGFKGPVKAGGYMLMSGLVFGPELCGGVSVGEVGWCTSGTGSPHSPAQGVTWEPAVQRGEMSIRSGLPPGRLAFERIEAQTSEQ